MTLITKNTKYFEFYYFSPFKKIGPVDQYCDYVIKTFSKCPKINYQNRHVCISNKNHVLISRRIGNYNGSDHMHTHVILNLTEYKLRISKTIGRIAAKDSCLDYIIYKKQKYIFTCIHAVKRMKIFASLISCIVLHKKHSLDC